MAETKVSQNLTYSWWTHPIAVREAGTDNILFCGVTDDGHPRVFRREPGEDYTQVAYHQMQTGSEPDDHNSPSVLSVAGKDLIVFWQRHNMETKLHYWKAPEGTFNFGSKQSITFPGGVSYCQTVVNGDTIYAFVRSGGSDWYYTVSTDWGDTWSTPAKFFDSSAYGGQHYCLIQPLESDPTKYHLAIYGHPTSTPWRDVIYGQIDATTGDISDFSGVVANLDGTNLPLTHTSLDTAWTPDPNIASQKVRMLDVGDKQGKNVIIVSKWDDNSLSPQYHFLIQDPTTGTWEDRRYGSSGGVFDDGAGRKYVWGACFDRNGRNLVYLLVKTSCRWEVNRHALTPDLGLYDKYLLQSNTTYPLVRPYAVRGKDAVLWQELREYGGFTDYRSYLWLQEDL